VSTATAGSTEYQTDTWAEHAAPTRRCCRPVPMGTETREMTDAERERYNAACDTARTFNELWDGTRLPLEVRTTLADHRRRTDASDRLEAEAQR
jgi:hypothetical protein